MTETESSSASGTPRGETDTSMSTEPPVPTPDAGPPTATTTSSTSFKPKKPKFGGIEQVGTDSWAIWTGGKPKTDFSELEDTSPSEIQPNQYRATSVSTLPSSLDKCRGMLRMDWWESHHYEDGKTDAFRKIYSNCWSERSFRSLESTKQICPTQ